MQHKKAYKLVTGDEFNPSCAGSDNADALKNGMIDAFGAELKCLITCGAHLLKEIAQGHWNFKNDDDKKWFYNCVLQIYREIPFEDMEYAINTLLKADCEKKGLTTHWKRFSDNWFSTNACRFATKATPIGIPCHNNGLEWFNSVLKKLFDWGCTIVEFLNQADDVIALLSFDYANKPFPSHPFQEIANTGGETGTAPHITKRLCEFRTGACDLAAAISRGAAHICQINGDKVQVLKSIPEHCENVSFYVITLRDNESDSLEHINSLWDYQKIDTIKGETLLQFTDRRTRFHRIEYAIKQWGLYACCDCSKFSSHYACRHVAIVLSRNGHLPPTTNKATMRKEIMAGKPAYVNMKSASGVRTPLRANSDFTNGLAKKRRHVAVEETDIDLLTCQQRDVLELNVAQLKSVAKVLCVPTGKRKADILDNVMRGIAMLRTTKSCQQQQQQQQQHQHQQQLNQNIFSPFQVGSVHDAPTYNSFFPSPQGAATLPTHTLSPSLLALITHQHNMVARLGFGR